MQRVSFKVANAIKEAGYPQEGQRYQYSYEGNLVDLVRDGGICYGPVAPTYLEVWLWLWREKKIYIQAERNRCILSFLWGDSCTFRINSNPEEAIIEAIEYLGDNNVIE